MRLLKRLESLSLPLPLLARKRSAARSAPAPLLGEKQTSDGRLAATDFMSTHPTTLVG
jgi:hypothetical protein